MQWSGYRLLEFLNIGVVYYVMQLVRCALLSYAVCALVFFLRKTVLKNNIFLKGALWSLFLPVLFAGRMKFFYENRLGSRLFFRWTMLSMKHVRVCWLYLCGVFLYGFLVLRKRHRFKKLISGLEKRWLEGTAVYVADGPVTPSATGVLHPKIVMPGIILEGYGRDEIEMILLHEKLHIRLGHLLFYLLWDILRVLLWINPLLTAGMKFLREDMEEICDRAAIRRSGGNAHAYGQVLLKSMRLLQTAGEELHGCASFTGGDRSENRRFPGSFLRKYRGQVRDMCGYKYEKTRQRIARIAGYRPYPKRAAIGAAAAAALCVAGVLAGLQRISYARYSADESVLVYGYDDGEGVVFVDNSDELRRMISYDDSYVYVDREAFERFLDGRRRAEEEIFIVFGGFYKLPGFGSGGSSCCYEIVSEDKEAAHGEAVLEEGKVRIPYEKQREDWMLALFKRL